jgi:hypothetical protein
MLAKGSNPASITTSQCLQWFADIAGKGSLFDLFWHACCI